MFEQESQINKSFSTIKWGNNKVLLLKNTRVIIFKSLLPENNVHRWIILTFYIFFDAISFFSMVQNSLQNFALKTIIVNSTYFTIIVFSVTY
jgi:hypothetical protein